MTMNSPSNIIICFLLSITICTVISGADEYVQVSIQNGIIAGRTILDQDIALNQFLGIPYAQPPIGELRYQRPRPFQQKFEQEPYQATEWPSSCPQLNTPYNNITKYQNDNFSEDCLYLNVWSPDVNVEDENQLRPVIVYIHGGGLLFGSSSVKIHDGRTLSALADAVVVTINYRLSTFGLLYAHQIDTIQGNMALWDQAMALEWIQDNIRYFGGQPKSVTIIGESAGSWSVSAHILSPVSRNLFHNAFMMSGSIVYYIAEPEQLEQTWLDGIRAVGCASESDQTITQQVLDCLNKLDVQQLSMVPLLSSSFKPLSVVDGQFFPEHPKKMLENGNYKKNFNLLLSTMEDECSGLLIMLSEQIQDAKRSGIFSYVDPDPIDYEEAKASLKMFVKLVASRTIKDDDETMHKIYFNGINKNIDHQDLLRKIVGVAFGDMWLGCQTMEFGKKVFSGDSDQTNVYQLYNTYKMGFIKDYCTAWAGSCHADDLYYLFGVPLRDRSKYYQREREISLELISTIKSFIRTGLPNQIEQPEWQRFFMDIQDGQKQVIAPYYELSNQYRTHKSYGINLKQTECEFWKKYYH